MTCNLTERKAKTWRSYTILLTYCLVSAMWPIEGQAQTAFFPLKDVKPGMRGVGRTIFQGDKIEEFQVEILGVLENLGPQQSIVLARLKGGPLAETGILQGMSGSPVYIDGKLLGAVALGFPFSKDAITGIQPIEQMIRSVPISRTNEPKARAAAWSGALALGDSNKRTQAEQPVPGRLKILSTPLSMSGFTEHTVQHFLSAFRGLGFEPEQAFGAGTPETRRYTGTVQPGSMISVQLMSGDLSMSAEGTVTHVDGKKVYAFGHRFLDSGTTDLPFARAEVLTVLPNVSTSFKISAAKELVGSITSDRNTAVAGEIGRAARVVPLVIAVNHPGIQREYKIQVVSDRLLTPILTQSALFSAIDATERTVGTGTMKVSGRVEFEGNAPPLVLQNTYASDTNVAIQAAGNIAVPFSFAMQSGFGALRPRSIRFEITPDETKRQYQIEQVWTSKHEVRPGESVKVFASFVGEDGAEATGTLDYLVPTGIQEGQINLTISDANTLNFPELSVLSPTSLRTPEQLIGVLNRIRTSERAYVRIWRQEPSFTLPGNEISDPPPAVAMLLGKSRTSSQTSRGAQLAELSFAPKVPALALQGGFVISGSKTIQVDVKE